MRYEMEKSCRRQPSLTHFLARQICCAYRVNSPYARLDDWQIDMQLSNDGDVLYHQMHWRTHGRPRIRILFTMGDAGAFDHTWAPVGRGAGRRRPNLDLSRPWLGSMMEVRNRRKRQLSFAIFLLYNYRP